MKHLERATALLVLLTQYAITLLVLLTAISPAVSPGSEPARTEMGLSLRTRHLADNTDGSCVQCSVTHLGYQCHEPAAATVLINSQFGPAIRGGSTPSRVASYFNQRHIKGYNITGMGDGVRTGTKAWMNYAVRTGRFAAIGFTRAHFETLWGKDGDTWLVVNNQLPAGMAVEEYSDQEFMRHHLESGPWIVVLQKSSSDNPELEEWWK